MKDKKKASHLKIVKKRDEGFLYFTTDEALKRLSIDPKLKKTFVNVMKKLEEYFDSNSYKNTEIYIERLKRHLLSKWGKKIKINIAEMESHKLGTYENNEILINESVLEKYPERIEPILCNNILKVIATADLIERKVSQDQTEVIDKVTQEKKDEEIFKKGFTYEALAAGMTKEIYPDYGANMPHIMMQKFFNRLTGSKNNYSNFLDGKFFARPYQLPGVIYEEYADDFQRNYLNRKGMTYKEAARNYNYVSMQREIISGYFFKLVDTKDYNAYVHALLLIRKRPVRDTEDLNFMLDNVEEEMISRMGFSDKRMAKIALKQIHETRFLIEDLFEIDKPAKEEKQENKTHTLLSQLESGRNNIYIPSLTQETEDLIGEERLEILNKLKKLSYMFGPDIYENFEYLHRTKDEIIDVVNVIKFVLPNMKDSNGETVKVYMNSGKNNNFRFFDFYQAGDQVKNVEIIEKDREKEVEGEKKIIPIANTISILTAEEINEKALVKVQERLGNSQKERKKIAFSQINLNELTQERGYLSKNEEARKIYLQSQFDALSQKEKMEIRREVASENKRLVVFAEDEEIEIGELIEEDGKYKTIKAEKQILVDKSKDGIYNDFYKIILKQKKKEMLGAPDLDDDYY